MKCPACGNEVDELLEVEKNYRVCEACSEKHMASTLRRLEQEGLVENYEKDMWRITEKGKMADPSKFTGISEEEVKKIIRVPWAIAARNILVNLGWGEEAIEAALNPSPQQAAERGMLPVARVNPEQHAAIKFLHHEGWGSHDISEAIPVSEAEIVRVLRLGWQG
ncbi:hypothetical protein LCGC14_1072070 [marine sediment metagenome]|uniref:Uncharacterized protein n=1 Tax=marine sediment metagenome TaxID=412755 RepID=A0A0F9N567_9ZZZZ